MSSSRLLSRESGSITLPSCRGAEQRAGVSGVCSALQWEGKTLFKSRTPISWRLSLRKAREVNKDYGGLGRKVTQETEPCLGHLLEDYS